MGTDGQKHALGKCRDQYSRLRQRDNEWICLSHAASTSTSQRQNISDALEDGLAPLTFLFSGTIFHAAEDGSLQISQISWETEATFRMPVSAWRRLMDIYYPNTAWLPLRKDLFDRLHELKRNRAASGVEQVIESLLEEAADRVIS